MSIEAHFDIPFVARLASREKQNQQNYRPLIGIHKWFARRPGTLFRALLLAEFAPEKPLSENFFRSHSFPFKTIADPFMGGGTPLFEANRVGCHVVGFDVNPMSFWIVRQGVAPLDRAAFRQAAEEVIAQVKREIGGFYQTRCIHCGSSDAQVKYFLWVKQLPCQACGEVSDAFPGYLVAANERHTHFVVVCRSCKALNELEKRPDEAHPVMCSKCGQRLRMEGSARRNRHICAVCGQENPYPPPPDLGPPAHRLYAIEYYCAVCRPHHRGRFFKTPDEEDIGRFEAARSALAGSSSLPFIPDQKIPNGDETRRLHRWGYRYYRDLFNDRQLLSLSTLLQHLCAVPEAPIRHALLTVFSDVLRYQNMLCRYDTYALKCQDLFAVHGFPVGLVQCENNLLGIPAQGAGGFRHFVEKYDRAKSYCEAPFETVFQGGSKHLIRTPGERIEAHINPQGLGGSRPRAYLSARSAEEALLPPECLDAVLTDPPYFGNVQYAELMDFCYVWLRLALKEEFPEFVPLSTRSPQELTGNITEGRGLERFTEGLSRIFLRMAQALKPGAPLAFTYHHNDPEAYLPLQVAILDAGLTCTATLPCPAEMEASMHIHGTASSIIDTIFVCRAKRIESLGDPSCSAERSLRQCLETDVSALRQAGIRVTVGDLTCVALGHVSRLVIQDLQSSWRRGLPVSERLDWVRQQTRERWAKEGVSQMIAEIVATSPVSLPQLSLPGMNVDA